MYVGYSKTECLQNASINSSFHVLNMQGQQISTIVNFYGKVTGDIKDKQNPSAEFVSNSVTRTKTFQALLWLLEDFWHIRYEIPSAMLLLRALCCFRLSEDSKHLCM